MKASRLFAVVLPLLFASSLAGAAEPIEKAKCTATAVSDAPALDAVLQPVQKAQRADEGAAADFDPCLAQCLPNFERCLDNCDASDATCRRACQLRMRQCLMACIP
jgi:hypothetical protein